MSAKFTPGPWHVNWTRLNGKAIGFHVADETHGSIRPVCEFYDGTEAMPPEEVEANARLIAAAPKLLEALQRLLSENDNMTQRINLLGAMDQARAALAATQPSADEPVTDSYVQVVPDKCDRIVWRGRYIHLSVGQKTTPQPSYDGWIPWAGGDCPVTHDTVVDVRLRNLGEGRAVASNWRWRRAIQENSLLGGADIVAYRVVKL